MPAEAVARTTLEVVALLLTLLFFAVQYATRNLEGHGVPDETIADAMDAVVKATFYLTLTVLVAVVVLVTTTDHGGVTVMLFLLYVALVVVGVSIRNTASTLRDYSDPQMPSTRLKLDDDQATLEEFDG